MLETGSFKNVIITVIAEKFVRDRIKTGNDYIKIIANVLSFTQKMIDALIIAVYGHNRKIIIYAAATKSFYMGVVSGGDYITYIPLDAPLNNAWAA